MQYRMLLRLATLPPAALCH